MHPMVNIAIRAARAAGNIIMRNLDRVDRLKIVSKQNNDFVTEVDHQAEQAIIASIHQAYPEHSIFAEESGRSGGRGGNKSGSNDDNNEYLWIIDPLDGTTNFLHGFPQFAVSIAFQHNRRLEAAVIYDPVSQELFSAARGEGALLNEKKIRVSGHNGLQGALLATGFPYTDQSYLDVYLQTLKAMMAPTAGIRRPGSAALDLAWTAAGRVDGFWEFNLNAWDIAAGALIVREAGGIVADFKGGEDYLTSGDIVAASPKVLPEMMRIIDRYVRNSDYLRR